MELNYTYRKIKKIAKEVKKKYTIHHMVEICPFIFQDDDIFEYSVREGADLTNNDAAAEMIEKAMIDGIDYMDVQKEVIRSLIKANFCVKELTEMLNTLEVSTEVQTA